MTVSARSKVLEILHLGVKLQYLWAPKARYCSQCNLGGKEKRGGKKGAAFLSHTYRLTVESIAITQLATENNKTSVK